MVSNKTLPIVPLQVIESNKALLKQKYDSAKAVGAQVNASKTHIAELKALIEQHRVQQAVAGRNEEQQGEDDPEEARSRALIEQVTPGGSEVLAAAPSHALIEQVTPGASEVLAAALIAQMSSGVLATRPAWPEGPSIALAACLAWTEWPCGWECLSNSFICRDACEQLQGRS